MNNFQIGDVVTRKSYGNDLYFKISAIENKDGNKIFILKGILYRIEADSSEEDLTWQHPKQVSSELKENLASAEMSTSPAVNSGLYEKIIGSSGTILHIDSSTYYLEISSKFYSRSNLKVYCNAIPENQQPDQIKPLLESTSADILIITGHDGIGRNATDLNSIDSYRNSRYFIQSVIEARKFEADKDKLCIFAGGCQSFYDGIINAGANFASSPGKVLIHALDPAKVGERVAMTDSRYTVTPEKIAEITVSGSNGIGGIAAKGHYILNQRI